ncbi:MAG: Fe-S cluster assembly protein SufD [Bacteroidales bacterium]|nr:Fe-S cluster assembly protein SufD [Bacteroidales bacterium]
MEDILKQKFISEFNNNKDIILSGSNGSFSKYKIKAFEHFIEKGLPDKTDENWRYSDLNKVILLEFVGLFERPVEDLQFKDIFKCDVPQLNSIFLQIVNGWFPQTDKNLTIHKNGMITGSFAAAIKEYPELVEKHYKNANQKNHNGLEHLNTAIANDGFFIYVPDNIIVEQPVQVVNIVYYKEDLNIFQRNLVITGKNSKIQLVICDHSMYFNKSFINSYTQIIAEPNSVVDYNKLQNYSNITSQYNSTEIFLKRDSRVISNILTLHGGFTRNDIKVSLEEPNAEVKLNGLYLMDRVQHIDNFTYIEHKVPHCSSNEKYKGILDDKATGAFNGKILVEPDAQKTNAFQINKNILLTENTTINTKPQLEIYADDVKCSHGATIGQLDDNAMFYLRSRGISQAEARMLLMYAFAYEVIKEINIEPLRERIDDLVSKRLRGEMSRCNHCAIRCS